MDHNCKHETDIQDLKIKLAVAESDVKQVKHDIEGIKNDIKDIMRNNTKLIWFGFATVLGILVEILLQFYKK